MTLKEFVLSRFQLFFFLVTMILLTEYFIGVVSAPDQVLHNKDLLGPVAAAGLCIIPTCVTYFKNEPTFKQYIFRLIIQMLLIEGIMLTAVNPNTVSDENKTSFYITVGVSTFVIYVLALLIMYYKNYLQSKALTSELKRFQKKECEAA
ncbi:MAG: hypothetical protein II685_06865 [Clostridia bacterium]|nr:hypothetical protein [Clostridia bacterium]